MTVYYSGRRDKQLLAVGFDPRISRTAVNRATTGLLTPAFFDDSILQRQYRKNDNIQQ